MSRRRRARSRQPRGARAPEGSCWVRAALGAVSRLRRRCPSSALLVPAAAAARARSSTASTSPRRSDRSSGPRRSRSGGRAPDPLRALHDEGARNAGVADPLRLDRARRGADRGLRASSIAPTLPPPATGRNVVAWAHPTTGVAENCAPSLLKDALDTIPHLPALMALDDVVVATDYPGLGTPGPHPYLVGESEGRAVLDSVRAARQIPKIGAGPRFAAWGHSQGGQAVLFAGSSRSAYAPELTLVGVAAIAPATDLAPAPEGRPRRARRKDHRVVLPVVVVARLRRAARSLRRSGGAPRPSTASPATASRPKARRTAWCSRRCRCRRTTCRPTIVHEHAVEPTPRAEPARPRAGGSASLRRAGNSTIRSCGRR